MADSADWGLGSRHKDRLWGQAHPIDVSRSNDIAANVRKDHRAIAPSGTERLEGHSDDADLIAIVSGPGPALNLSGAGEVQILGTFCANCDGPQFHLTRNGDIHSGRFMTANSHRAKVHCGSQGHAGASKYAT
jgi:hypothetical protein